VGEGVASLLPASAPAYKLASFSSGISFTLLLSCDAGLLIVMVHLVA
jgi:hypothetical protein